MKAWEMVEAFSSLGFQAIELYKAARIVYKMKKEGAKTILAFTSNLGTSGLRDFFAQLVEMGMVDMIVTTAGSIEEDIMKAMGERFLITRFDADDIELHDRGINRIGNLGISTDSYMRFEAFMKDFLMGMEGTVAVHELLRMIGERLDDNNSFLRQAYLKGIPVICPAIMDGAIGFHLYMARQRSGFSIDQIADFAKVLEMMDFDSKKGLISLGGGISKHFALLATMISGGADYAVYVTTSRHTSGSMSGATTSEAKSWGKIRDDSDSVTVIGDATILFPLIMSHALEKLSDEGIIRV